MVRDVGGGSMASPLMAAMVEAIAWNVSLAPVARSEGVEGLGTRRATNEKERRERQTGWLACSLASDVRSWAMM